MHHVTSEFPAPPLMQHSLGDKFFFAQFTTAHASPVSTEITRNFQRDGEGNQESVQVSRMSTATATKVDSQSFLWGMLSAQSRAAACSLQPKHQQLIQSETQQSIQLQRNVVSWWIEVTCKLCRTGTCSLPFEFVIPTEAPQLGASPDVRMYDLMKSLYLDLLRWKAAWKILSVSCYASSSRTMQVWGINTGMTVPEWCVTVCMVAACFVVAFLVFSADTSDRPQVSLFLGTHWTQSAWSACVRGYNWDMNISIWYEYYIKLGLVYLAFFLKIQCSWILDCSKCGRSCPWNLLYVGVKRQIPIKESQILGVWAQ